MNYCSGSAHEELIIEVMVSGSSSEKLGSLYEGKTKVWLGQIILSPQESIGVTAESDDSGL